MPQPQESTIKEDTIAAIKSEEIELYYGLMILYSNACQDLSHFAAFRVLKITLCNEYCNNIDLYTLTQLLSYRGMLFHRCILNICS